jgi:hypothetical protein
MSSLGVAVKTKMYLSSTGYTGVLTTINKQKRRKDKQKLMANKNKKREN